MPGQLPEQPTIPQPRPSHTQLQVFSRSGLASSLANPIRMESESLKLPSSPAALRSAATEGSRPPVLEAATPVTAQRMREKEPEE